MILKTKFSVQNKNDNIFSKNCKSKTSCLSLIELGVWMTGTKLNTFLYFYLYKTQKNSRTLRPSHLSA